MPSVFLVGLNHRTAPIEIRERFSPLTQLDDGWGGSGETTLIATCNRLEVYATGEDVAAGWEGVTRYLAHLSAVPVAELRPLLYYRRDREAVCHLLRVAAGLDSLVLGEPQILGQVAAAHAAAHAAGDAGAVLSHLFHQALHCGKQVRAETAIASGATSLSNTAVRLAARRLGDLSSCSALVVGAGEMASHAAIALRQAGAGSILCINRSLAHAEQLAQRVGGSAMDWTQLSDALPRVDLVVSATSAPHVVIEADLVRGALTHRADRPLLLVDIALPRDIDPAVDAIANVTRLDIDHLRDVFDARQQQREAAIPRAEQIVEAQASTFCAWLESRHVVSALVTLRGRAEDVANLELERTIRRLDHLAYSDPTVKREVTMMAQRIVAKLLHEPTVRLKAQAANGNGTAYAHLLAELFALDSGSDVALTQHGMERLEQAA